MQTHFSDRASFLAAVAPLREAIFAGVDLSYDPDARTMTLTLTHTMDRSGAGRKLFASGLQRSCITVRGITTYRQYLTGLDRDGYILDRAEVGRGGQELAFYFRPGDRAVMDIASIQGHVELLGPARSAPRPQPNVNPLMKAEMEHAGRSRSLLGRLLGRPD